MAWRGRPTRAMLVGVLLSTGLLVAMPASMAQAGWFDIFTLSCPPDNNKQDDVVTVHVLHAATIETALESPPGTPVPNDQPICPGTVTTYHPVIRVPDPSKPGYDKVTEKITTDNTKGGGTAEDKQVEFKAQTVVSLDVVKVSLAHTNVVHDGKEIDWKIVITNIGKVPAKHIRITDDIPGDLRWTEVDERPGCPHSDKDLPAIGSSGSRW